METEKLTAEPREEKGTSAARRLRRAGKIPAVLYGGGDAEPIVLDDKDFRRVDHGGTSLLTLELPGRAPTTAVVREIQRDPIRDVVVHVDFLKVAMTDTIHVTIPVNLVGEAPGVKMGGVLQHALWELELQALASSIPASIEVDISELDMGGAIHVSDIEMPEGVEVLTSGEASIVTILAPTIHVEEEVVPEEEALEAEAAEAAEEGAPSEGEEGAEEGAGAGREG